MSFANKVEESVFEIMRNGDLKIENAVLAWPNFSGKATQFNPNGGKRTFCVLLNEEIADILSADGWNVKRRPPREDGDYPLIYTEIVINMQSQYPPDVYVRNEFNGKGTMRKLTDDNISMLDNIQIVNADLVIHPYEHGIGQFKVKGYARFVNVLQAQSNYFGDKYSEYESEDAEQTEMPF